MPKSFKERVRDTFAFLEHLRQSDISVRRRWLFIFSAGAMLIILAVWLLSLNSLLADYGTPASATAVVETDGPSFFEIVGTGSSAIVATLRERTANTILFFKEKFEKTNVVDITPNTSSTTK